MICSQWMHMTLTHRNKPMNAGTTIIAFVEDPDGYPIELIGRKAH